MMNIRKKVVIPALLVILLIGFALLSLGSIIKWSLINGIQSSTYSEVNVDDVSVHYFPFSVSIRGLQVSNPKKLTHNYMSLNQAKVTLYFLPLLKKKVIIEEIRIDALEFDSRRQHVAKSFAHKKTDQEESQMSKLAKSVFGTETLFDIEVPEIEFTNTNLLVKDMETQYLTIQRAFSNESKSKYQTDIDQIRKEIDSLLKRKIQSPNDLIQFKNAYNLLNQKINGVGASVTEDYDRVAKSLDNLGKDIRGLDPAAKKDYENIISNISIGHLDTASLSDKMISPYVQDRLDSLKPYIEWGILIKERLGSPAAPKRFFRLAGRDIPFKDEEKLPTFLLKSLDGSGEGVRLSVQNLSSDRSMLKYPLKGELSVKGLYQAQTVLSLHLQQTDLDRYRLLSAIEGIQVTHSRLFKDKHKSIVLQSADLVLKGETMIDRKDYRVNFDLGLKNTQFVSTGFKQSNILEKLLQSGLAQTHHMGVWGRFDSRNNRLKLGSTFDDGFKHVIQDEIDQQVAQLRHQIQSEIDTQVNIHKRHFEELQKSKMQELQAWESELSSELSRYSKELEAEYQKQVNSQKKQIEGKAQKVLKNIQSDALKSLKL